MVQINDTIISTEVLKKKFVCDLNKCKGACCIHGDSGAPLEEHETAIIKNIFPAVKPFMRKAGIEAVEKQGIFVVDRDGDIVTPLVNGQECSYVTFKNGISLCAFELAWQSNATNFKKPISCHLYPIRITKYENFEAINYHKWDICNPALLKGENLNISLTSFLKESLLRKYGHEWYEKLKIVEDEVIKRSKNEGSI